MADKAYTFAFYDDILIVAKNQSEHDVTLAKVFSILSANGVTLNKDKCLFACESLEFLGTPYHLQVLCLHQVKTIQELPEPQTKSQLWSFLGLGTFVEQKFVQNFALLAAPLGDYVRGMCKFEWTTEYREAFRSLQTAIGKASGTVWFDVSKEVVDSI